MEVERDGGSEREREGESEGRECVWHGTALVPTEVSRLWVAREEKSRRHGQ